MVPDPESSVQESPDLWTVTCRLGSARNQSLRELRHGWHSRGTHDQRAV